MTTKKKKHAKNFYVLDTETTGLLTKELIEVAAVLFQEGKEVKRVKEVFLPKKKITDEAKKIHGYSKSKLKGLGA